MWSVIQSQSSIFNLNLRSHSSISIFNLNFQSQFSISIFNLNLTGLFSMEVAKQTNEIENEMID